MKLDKVIRWLLKVSAFAALLLIMQGCGGNPFSLETPRKPSIFKKAEVDTTVSEDLRLFGFTDKDGVYVDEDYVE